MNPRKASDLKRLKSAKDFARKELQVFRENRIARIKQVVGCRYGEDGSKTAVPLPMMEQALGIYTRLLVASMPRTLCTSRNPQKRGAAADLEVSLNDHLCKMMFERTLRLLVSDGIYSLGIAKTGITAAGSVEIDGIYHNAGEPFCDRVDLDDWVHDTSARSFDEIQFCGNRYVVSLEEARNNEYFDEEARAKLGTLEDRLNNPEGDERTEAISHGSSAHNERFRDQCELWDIWIPREQLLLTFPEDSDDWEHPLRVIEWDGPATGPYDILSYGDVPNNIMPLSPLARIEELHELANGLMRKLMRQAQRQKTGLAVPGAAAIDGERTVNFNDGDAFRVDSAIQPKEVSYGGPNQVNLAYMMMAKQMFEIYGGNLTSIGGLGAEADTVGQEQLIAKSSSKQIEDMRVRTVEFTKRLVTKIGGYLYTDPTMRQQLTHRFEIPGGKPIEIPFEYGPEHRTGKFSDYDIEIDPYSMPYQTPAQRFQTAMQFVQTCIMPALPIAAQQGTGINFEAMVRMAARYLNLPELLEIVTMVGATQGQSAGPTDRPPRPGTTTRTNVRVNKSGGGTREGRDSALVQALLSGGMDSNSGAALAQMAG